MLATRKHPRIALAATVTIVAPELRIEAEATEIGAGGMSVRCDDTLDISQPVELQFRLPPDGPEIRVAAIVWWKKDAHVGLRFDPLSAHRTTIERWIAQRLETARYCSKPI